MTYENIIPILKLGKIGMLPKYEGYFHWNFGTNQLYMKNKDYITYDLDNEKQRNDWFYII